MKRTGLKHQSSRRISKEQKSYTVRAQLRQKHDYIPGEDLPAWRSLIRFVLLGLLVAGFIYLTVVSVNILILGTDDVDYSKHTDTIMLVHWKPLPRRMALLSVPRDTLIRLPKRGVMKINAVYAYGTAVGSRDYALAMTRATIENLLGLKVHYTVHIKYSSFIKLVDALGGVPLYVMKKMHYIDNAGGVNIDLDAGYQLLDGRQSLNYVRFRHDRDGDIGRIRRQQTFVKAFLTQLAKFSKLPRTLGSFSTFIKEVETNLTIPAAVFLATEVKSIAGNSWRQAILPGKGVYIKGISYWRTDPDEVRKVVLALGNPPKKKKRKQVVEPLPAKAAQQPITVKEERVAEPVIIAEPIKPRRISLPLPTGPQPIIRVLNGCGVSGVASKIAKKVQAEKILIKEADITNAPSFDYPLTIIKASPRNMNWARKIANALELEEDRLQEVPKKISYPSVTIVIGDDYRELLSQ